MRNGGEGGNTASVRYLSYTQAPPIRPAIAAKMAIPATVYFTSRMIAENKDYS